METKLCPKCGKTKPTKEFSKNKRNKDGLQTNCKICCALESKKRRDETPELREARLAYNKARRNEIKKQVFDHYGSYCKCCGETTFLFLTLDHINNDGSEHRKQLAEQRGYKKYRDMSTDQLYRDLVSSEFKDADRFQILCYNCNCGKRGNGGIFCPHIKEGPNGTYFTFSNFTPPGFKPIK